MAARTKSLVYHIYLLTVWPVQDPTQAGEGGWHFHLTDPQTGKRYGFTNSITLLAALQTLTREQPPADAPL
jgi:hypothetical protein